MDVLEILDELHHFNILLASHEGTNWNTVGKLEGEGIHVVVHDQDVFRVDTIEHPKVFHEEAMVFYVGGVLPEESVLNKLTCWVDEVNDRVRIPLVTGREYSYFKKLVGFPKALDGERSH